MAREEGGPSHFQLDFDEKTAELDRQLQELNQKEIALNLQQIEVQNLTNGGKQTELECEQKLEEANFQHQMEIERFTEENQELKESMGKITYTHQSEIATLEKKISNEKTMFEREIQTLQQKLQLSSESHELALEAKNEKLRLN